MKRQVLFVLSITSCLLWQLPSHVLAIDYQQDISQPKYESSPVLAIILVLAIVLSTGLSILHEWYRRRSRLKNLQKILMLERLWQLKSDQCR